MRVVDRLLGWLQRPIDGFLWIGIVAGFLMMTHVTIDVLGRYVFNRPIEGTTEIVAAYYMVVVAYMPWAHIATRDSHIVAGFFKQIGSKRFDRWLEIAVKIATMIYLAAFIYQTTLQAFHQTEAGEVWLAGTKYIPVWPTRWLLPCSAILMFVYLVLRVITDISRGPSARSPRTG